MLNRLPLAINLAYLVIAILLSAIFTGISLMFAQISLDMNLLAPPPATWAFVLIKITACLGLAGAIGAFFPKQASTQVGIIVLSLAIYFLGLAAACFGALAQFGTYVMLL